MYTFLEKFNNYAVSKSIRFVEKRELYLNSLLIQKHFVVTLTFLFYTKVLRFRDCHTFDTFRFKSSHIYKARASSPCLWKQIKMS